MLFSIRVNFFFILIQHEHICINYRLAVTTVINRVNCQLQLLYEKQWKDILNADHAKRGQEEGGNKLRTYGRVCYIIIGYEPAGLTVHPPPRMIEGGFIFFVWVSSVTKIFSSKKKWIL